MSDRGLYRSRALARRDEQESIDAVPRVTAPHEWAIVAGLFVLVIVALVWAIFGRVEVSSTVDGVLVRPGERSIIVSALPGTVTDVLAEPGQAVAAGAPVVTLELAGLDLQIRIARTTEELLADLLDRVAETTPALQASLAQATAARLELTALRTAGSVIVSPRSGALTVLHVAAGDTVQAGTTIADLRSDAAGPVTAVTLVSAEQARDVRPGMAARILFERAGEQHALPAEVTTVAEPGRPPAWLRDVPFAEPWAHGEAGGVLVTFALAAPQEALAVDDLWPCRVEIVQQRVAPLSLLAAGSGS